MSSGDTIVVGIGEMKITRGTGVLACLGIGSCIALCAYDKVTRVGGMAHIVLPHYDGNGQGPSPRYADSAVPLMLDELRKQGAHISTLVVKMAGGARMSLAPGINGVFKIGERNIEATRAAISGQGIPLAAVDTGGSQGRTVRLFLDSGRVTITTAGKLCEDL